MAIHDVTPRYESEIETIVAGCSRLVGKRCVFAVVPDWHFQWPLVNFPRCINFIAKHAGEIIQHGYSHLNNRPPGIISYLTHRSDEFSTLALTIIKQHLADGTMMLQKCFERPIRGFAPPAWQFSAHQAALLHSLSFQYLTRFSKVEYLGLKNLSVNTFSWDWGRFFRCGLAGEFLGRTRLFIKPGMALQLVIHPLDLQRGYFKRSLSIIHSLLTKEWIPMNYQELKDTGMVDENLVS